MALDEKLNFESLVVEGHEIRKVKQEGNEHFKYLFYRERNSGSKDFVLVYAGLNENAWKEIKWGELNNAG